MLSKESRRRSGVPKSSANSMPGNVSLIQSIFKSWKLIGLAAVGYFIVISTLFQLRIFGYLSVKGAKIPAEFAYLIVLFFALMAILLSYLSFKDVKNSINRGF